MIEWWERRRLFFNLVVGGAGLVTCCAMVACAVVAEPLVGEAVGLPDLRSSRFSESSRLASQQKFATQEAGLLNCFSAGCDLAKTQRNLGCGCSASV